MRLVTHLFAAFATTFLTFAGCAGDHGDVPPSEEAAAAAGTSGTGGTAGSSGNSGSSGTAGSAGTGAVAGASGSSGTSGTSGTSGSAGTGGTAGTAGTAGAGGTAGNAGASGTGGMGGSAGTGGSSDCTEVTVGAFQSKPDGSVQGEVTPALGGAGPDSFLIELVDGMTGTFDLATGSDINYKTCDHCLSVFEDTNDTGTPARRYFQSQGSITVTVADPNLDATSAGSISDLTLIEVTIVGGGDFTSNPVPGGKCIHVSTVSWDTTL